MGGIMTFYVLAKIYSQLICNEASGFWMVEDTSVSGDKPPTFGKLTEKLTHSI